MSYYWDTNRKMSYYWDTIIEDLLTTATEEELSKLEKEIQKIDDKGKPVTNMDEIVQRVKTGLVDTRGIKNKIEEIRAKKGKSEKEEKLAKERLQAVTHPQFVEACSELGAASRKLKKIVNRKFEIKLEVPYVLKIETESHFKNPSELVENTDDLNYELVARVKTTACTLDKQKLNYTIPVNEFIVDKFDVNIAQVEINDKEMFAFFPEWKKEFDKAIKSVLAIDEKMDAIPVEYRYGLDDIDELIKQ